MQAGTDVLHHRRWRTFLSNREFEFKMVFEIFIEGQNEGGGSLKGDAATLSHRGLQPIWYPTFLFKMVLCLLFFLINFSLQKADTTLVIISLHELILWENHTRLKLIKPTKCLR